MRSNIGQSANRIITCIYLHLCNKTRRVAKAVGIELVEEVLWVENI